MTFNADNEAEWRAEFERDGERLVYDTITGRTCGSYPEDKRQYAFRWLRNREQAREVRAIIHSPSALGEPDDTEISKLDRDVKKILERAKAESRSGQPANWDFQNTHIKCPSNSCRG
jgi:hypothetical protein